MNYPIRKSITLILADACRGFLSSARTVTLTLKNGAFTDTIQFIDGSLTEASLTLIEQRLKIKSVNIFHIIGQKGQTVINIDFSLFTNDLSVSVKRSETYYSLPYPVFESSFTTLEGKVVKVLEKDNTLENFV